MDRSKLRIIEINYWQKFMLLKHCKECGSRMLTTQPLEHLVVVYPAIASIVENIAEKLKSFSYATHKLSKRKFPSEDCPNLCAGKVLANSLIEHLTKNDANCWFLIQELWEKIGTFSHGNLVRLTVAEPNYCHLCDKRLSNANTVCSHLILCHPECLALVQFLRYHPLSQLNIPNGVIVLRQSFVKLERLTSDLYRECIIKGHVNLQENRQSRFDAKPNPRLKRISDMVMTRIRGTTKQSPANFSSERCIRTCSRNGQSASLPNAHRNIILYGHDDLSTDLLNISQEFDEQFLQDDQMNCSSKNKVSVQESIKNSSSNMTVGKDNSQQEFDANVLQDFPKHSTFNKVRNEIPLQGKANLQLSLLNLENDSFEDDSNQPQLQDLVFEVKNKGKELENANETLISGNSSSKEVDVEILQDPINYSLSSEESCSEEVEDAILMDVRKHSLSLSSEESSSKEVDVEILQDVINYSLSLSSEESSAEEVEDAILMDVRKHSSTSKAKNTAPAPKRRFKMSAVPLTSEDKFDKPIIPRFSAANLEAGNITEKKREIELSELDIVEAEADDIFFKLLQKFYILK